MANPTSRLLLYFDGLCEPYNPGGTACYGWAILEEGVTLHTGKGFVCSGKGATNNVAEYGALIAGLEFLREQQATGRALTIRGDSMLVVRQVLGQWAVHSPLLRPLYQKARTLFNQFPDARLEWVPREKNQLADRLSREAYTEATAGQIPDLEKRKRLLRAAHAAAREFFSDDEERRQWQQQVTGLRSCKDMNEDQLRRLLKSYEILREHYVPF